MPAASGNRALSGGYFLKMGFAGGEHWMTGHQYIFHNTLFRADEWLPTGGLGGNRIVKHTSLAEQHPPRAGRRNRCVSEAPQNIDNDFDYDLYNGRVPPGHEAHGVRGEPVYAAGAGFDDATKTGQFQLDPSSPGAGAGQPIPNFSRGSAGPAPDMGAHQRGDPPLRYGVEARQP